MVKRYYDLRPDLRFVLSGSASLDIARRALESLAGRILFVKVPPLSFREFAEMRTGRDLAPLDAEGIEDAYLRLVPMEGELAALLDDYLLGGGFPEMVAERDLGLVHRYVATSVVERILYRDIPQVFDVRRPETLAGLLGYAARTSSCLFSVESLADTFKADRATVSNYLSYLDASFLVSVSFNEASGSPARRQRTSRKLYVADASLMAALNDWGRDALSFPEASGRLVETAAAAHCRCAYPTGFLRDGQGREVDLVLRTRSGRVPVEVKYRNDVAASDLRGVEHFARVVGAPFSLVVTKDRFERMKGRGGTELVLLPAWLFLLLAYDRVEGIGASRAARAPGTCTACPPTAARRLPTRSSTARAASCPTRPRSASTPRRPS
jgi:predicted AAA+ superfamily ATPase